MARCEDFPCCGHEAGCCPDFDPDTGEQLNMKCTCGATVPIDSPSSLCAGCLNSDPDGFDPDDNQEYPEDEDALDYDDDEGPDEYEVDSIEDFGHFGDPNLCGE